jgi:hypothetical protein
MEGVRGCSCLLPILRCFAASVGLDNSAGAADKLLIFSFLITYFLLFNYLFSEACYRGMAIAKLE